MPFVTLPGVTGKVYVPEKSCRTPCKHSCADCFSCQLCSEERCRLCRRPDSKGDESRKQASLQTKPEGKRRSLTEK